MAVVPEDLGKTVTVTIDPDYAALGKELRFTGVLKALGPGGVQVDDDWHSWLEMKTIDPV